MVRRRLGATLAGLVAGGFGFGALMLLGLLLYRRLFGDSAGALAVISLIFGAAGAYAGWLLGVIVFSALRGMEDGDGPAA